MKRDNYEAVKAFMSATAKLADTTQTMEDIYTAIVERDPNAWIAIYFDESGKSCHMTYDEFRNEVFRTASQLSGLFSSIAPRTIVGLKLKNSERWPIMFWAILMSEHIPLLIDARLPKENADNLLRQSGAAALIANDEETFCVPRYRVNEVSARDEDYSFNPDFADNVIFCSSGTTGDAKMMVFSGKNLCAQILASLSIPDKTLDLMYPSPIHTLAMLPFHHIFGFAVNLLWYTYYGKTLVYPSSLATSDLLAACRKGKCTHIYSVPLFWDGLAQTVNRTVASLKPSKSDLVSKMIAFNTHKISRREAGFAASKLALHAFQKKVLGKRVRYCISGGGFLSPKTQALVNGIGYNLYNGFGMTEVGIACVEQSPRVEQRMKGSIGAPFHGVEMKIACKEGETQGELLVKSPIVHEEEIIGGKRRKTPLTEDGFFRTGDIATMDNHGNFYLKGRLKDTIILSNGENVFPDEIEYYFKDVAGLNNVVCLGAKRPGATEEKITLVCEVDNSVTEETIERIFSDIKAINDTLPSEKKVQDILIDKHPLPMSSSMKVKRFVLKEAIEKGSDDFMGTDAPAKKTVSFDGYDQAKVDATLKKVTKCFSKVLMLPEFKIDPEAIWTTDLGGDSMSYIEMCQLLNKEFKLEIPEEQYGILACANDFTKEILDLQGEGPKD
ncbi:MAG: AMP-binding protein [Bacilli bacterium]|nr:AMP-binding protein [Bacilli bacterium]